MLRLAEISAAALLLTAPAWAGLTTDTEFAMAGGERLTLDAYVPEGKGPFPAVIIVHGGGWEAGTKTTYVPPLFEPLSKAGFSWFTINYRLAPKHPFPAATEDVFSAIRWVKRNAKRYKVDTRRIALMVESAGGHLVAYAGARGRGETAVAAVVSFYGVHDFLARAKQMGEVGKNVTQFLGVKSVEEEGPMLAASPITYVHAGMPPFLMIHGTEDKAVPFNQSPMMCAKMEQVGAACEVFRVDGAPHGIGNWEKNPEFQKYKEKMVEWLQRTLRSNK
jgi:acetyl esterase